VWGICGPVSYVSGDRSGDQAAGLDALEEPDEDVGVLVVPADFVASDDFVASGEEEPLPPLPAAAAGLAGLPPADEPRLSLR
jgi:hypothetical protein